MLDFVVLGARKAGTTSLHQYLDNHPGICMSRPKEPDFWFKEDEYRRGPDYYVERYLGHCEEACLTGEAHPDHLAEDPEDRACRLHRMVDDASLVALLREPVERAYSDWWQARCLGAETRSFDDVTDARSGYVKRGEYVRLLEPFLELFDRQQLLIVFSHELFEEPEGVVRRVAAQVGADPSVEVEADRAYNVSWNSPVAARISHMLSRSGIVRRLPEAIRRLGRSLLSNLGEKPPVPPEPASRLRDHYRNANQSLEKLAGRPVPWQS